MINTSTVFFIIINIIITTTTTTTLIITTITSLQRPPKIDGNQKEVCYALQVVRIRNIWIVSHSIHNIPSLLQFFL
jgi:hypothetical protein